MDQQTMTTEPKAAILLRWVRGLAHPVEPFGDYFVRLGSSVAASAPPCNACM